MALFSTSSDVVTTFVSFLRASLLLAWLSSFGSSLIDIRSRGSALSSRALLRPLMAFDSSILGELAGSSLTGSSRGRAEASELVEAEISRLEEDDGNGSDEGTGGAESRCRVAAKEDQNSLWRAL
jgi:hypothetical protein